MFEERRAIKMGVRCVVEVAPDVHVTKWCAVQNTFEAERAGNSIDASHSLGRLRLSM